ncbi:MAG: methyl-accepting chemotaxis protein [Spirochaetaceae bacterium]
MAKKTTLPLAVKIVGITAILIVLVLAIIIMFSSNDIDEHILEEEEHNITKMNDTAEDLISAEIKSILYQISLSSEHELLIEDIVENDNKKLINYASSVIDMSEFISEIYITNEKGDFLGSYPTESLVGQNINEFKHWNGMLAHSKKDNRSIYKKDNGKPTFEDVFISNPYMDEHTGDMVFSVSSPSLLHSEVIGILIFEIDIRLLYDRYLEDKAFGARGYMFLSDVDGTFLAHKNEDLDGQDFSHDSFMQKIIKMLGDGIKEGHIDYLWEGEDKSLAYDIIDNVDWFLATTVYDEDLRVLSKTLTKDMIVISGISLIVIIILIIFAITIFLSKPVNKVTVKLTESSVNLESASQQIAASSQQLSSGNSELAASIEEITSSLEELQSVIELNTKNINESELLMKETNANSQKVSTDMVDLSGALTEIGDNSEEIVNIVKVIEDIAFQTNILALNAAVEAGRAGEAGSGFAVVADQVKELAQKSSDSAKETAKLIKTAIDSISRGQEIGKSVKSAQDKTGEMSSNVTVLLNEVNRASKEQMKGINQITQAITQTNSVVQQTAASAEETASASEELLGQSEDMNDVVNVLNKIVKGVELDSSALRSRANTTNKVERTVNKTVIQKTPDSGFNPDDIIPMNDDFKEF